MSRPAWIYIGLVYLAAAILSGMAFYYHLWSNSQVPEFLVLLGLTTLSQLLKARAPGHQSYHITLIFNFASLLLLPQGFFILVIVISLLVEWIKERAVGSPRLRNWYLQPFNISSHILSGFAAHLVQTAFAADPMAILLPQAVFVVVLSAVVYVGLNHIMIGTALVLGRGVSWRESGILDGENLVTDLILLCLGYITAVLWRLNPWLILPALSPLVLMYRALMVPQLKKEAQTDEKTGLLNARYFSKMFTAEIDRATRFNRPVALIMADLDLLRNINNTYGHLAGDTVLAGIGQLIRSTIREYDIAGRFGGEEFSIVLPEAGPAEALSLAERLRQAIKEAEFVVTTSPTPIHATMSLGIACFPGDALTPNDLIHEADVAVYQAKLKGRNCTVLAAEVPHYIKLESISTEDRVTAPYVAAFIPRQLPSENGEGVKPADYQSATPIGEAQAKENKTAVYVPFFVSTVIALGLLLTLGGVLEGRLPDFSALALLMGLAFLIELMQVDLYGETSISVSVAINFAAALIMGIPGVAGVSLAIALAHYIQRRPPSYKTAFNWATHLLAGAAPAIIFRSVSLSPDLTSLVALVLPVLLASLAYYGIESSLIATVVSLSQGNNLITTWREQYRWLLDHYMVLCILGVFLGVAYMLLGVVGLVAFIMPIMMMRYAQKQYIERTEDSLRELKRLNQELSQANSQVVGATQAIRSLNEELFLAFSKIIDARDPYVLGHAAKVADYAAAIALELKLSSQRIDVIRQAAFLHDIGKIGISEQVLHKPSKLNNEEYAYIKTHVTLGASFLDTCQGLRHLTPFIKYHHERWDGTGYPEGLSGEAIPLEARILAVCDAVEAMASDRPYQRAMSLGEIVEEVRVNSGTQFDPNVAEIFFQLAERVGEDLISNSARQVDQKLKEDETLLPVNKSWNLLRENNIEIPSAG
ncbi:MAG: diguanylate cyclase [Chloroflexi bacterium]|nr:diguanylate cyclase [Chloroflexota bacterium]